jgi:hypothetical protein
LTHANSATPAGGVFGVGPSSDVNAPTSLTDFRAIDALKH